MQLFLRCLGAFLLVGCQAANGTPVVAEVAQPERIDRGADSVESEIGGMNHEDVEAQFAQLQEPILRCVREGTDRVRVMGGRFAVKLRINRKGEVVSAYLKESTLGDRATERCVLSVARSASWPKPLGGEGLAERSFDVDPSVEPIQWKPEKARGPKKSVGQRVQQCKVGVEGPFVATVYVSSKGNVLAAGVAPPDAAAEEAADCVADAVRGMKFGSPGRKPAKVTFEL
jgi:hypothetical protein